MLVKLVIFLELICYNDVKYIIRKDVTKGTVPLVNFAKKKNGDCFFTKCLRYLYKIKSLSFLFHFGEAFAAVYRSVFGGFEGNFAIGAACCTNCIIENSGTLSGSFSGISALFALFGLVLEAFFGIELLLTGRENEFLATLVAN